MKTIKKLVDGLDYNIVNNLDLERKINLVAVDSRKAKKHSMFVCIKGDHYDGHDFAEQAVLLGATVVVVEKEIENLKASQILVKNTKLAISKIAANFYGNPSRKMNVIGITGTNGKTTTSYIVKHIFEQVSQKCGLIGTIGVFDGISFLDTSLTTPQPLEVHKYFSQMLANNCQHAVMEVSSHSLSLHRVDDVFFDIAALTNISQDHLDYHGNMNEYINTKIKLFEKNISWAIINYDDKEHEKFIKSTKANVSGYSCLTSLSNGLYAVINRVTDKGMKFAVYYKNKPYIIETDMIGRFNVYNILLAMEIALKSQIDIESIVSAVNSFKSVPGRFEKVQGVEDISIIVDYAHTPDALENVLKTAKSLAEQRLIVVFGCGGDRDKTKRSIMGEIASIYGDVIIITSDNPRTEDPQIIINDIIKGIKNKKCVKIEISREKAIRKAIEIAAKSDIILIAGKGHETYQIIGTDKHDFDDRIVAKKIYDEVK